MANYFGIRVTIEGAECRSQDLLALFGLKGKVKRKIVNYKSFSSITSQFPKIIDRSGFG